MDARITFYDIAKSGFYHYGADSKAFGDLNVVLQDIISEFSGQDLVYTCPYLPKKGADVLRTFLYDIKLDSSGSCLLSTWNESQIFKNGIASVNARNKVGTMSVNLTPPPEDSIPGYPTYFWFLPELNIYATVVMGEAMLNGNQGMNLFMKKFMENFSSYAILDHLDGDDAPQGNTNFGHRVVGYAEPGTPDNDDMPRVTCHFETHLHRNLGQIEYIRRVRSRISNVVRRCGVDYSVNAQESLARAVIDDLSGGMTERENSKEPYKINYDISLCPSEKELEYMIDQWGVKYGLNKDDRVGFKVSGEQGVWWLDSSLARDDFELPVSEFEEGFPVTASLLECLESEKTHILKATGIVQ
jgi:hypothetical protein